MEDELITILSSLNIPVFRQGSLTADEAYPDLFFTFWQSEAKDDSFYDNANNVIIYNYDINIYGINPTSVYNTLKNAIKKLKENMWECNSDGYDVASDSSMHIGRGITTTFIKKG